MFSVAHPGEEGCVHAQLPLCVHQRPSFVRGDLARRRQGGSPSLGLQSLGLIVSAPCVEPIWGRGTSPGTGRPESPCLFLSRPPGRWNKGQLRDPSASGFRGEVKKPC